MKNRMKYMILALVGAVTLTVSCQREDLIGPENNTLGGYKTIEFMAQVPDMASVQTKAVDPDGLGVQQMTVFCFDENSLFITTVTAQLTQDAGNPSLSGKFTVTVPDHTVTLQLVGNQNLTYFKEDNYRGMSEVDVMAALEASAGRMIYWARETVESLKTHTSTETAVQLLRNQARITLHIDSAKSDFHQEGWVVVNSNAFGTVAPYSADHGGFVAPSLSTPFVTLPDNRSKLGEYLDVNTNDEQYIFETENTEADPIDFIVKGRHGANGESLYYRVSLIDEYGNNVMIMRNHHYVVNIVGALHYGKPTFMEALEAPATNNVWVSISDNIAEVMDDNYKLSVEKTFVVIGEDEFVNPNEYVLHYSIESFTSGETLTQADVSWMEGNNVALNSFSHTFDASTGVGTITVTLNDMDGLQKREGTLFIKKGRLSRKIKVVTVKEQTFVPSWITTNVYGGQTGENITMMFTIPDDCPQELFPMNVLVSVNDLDVRNESGMFLPVISAGEEGYGEDNGIGYKYVLTVYETGVQRLYLESILNQQTGDQVAVTIEAEHFASLTKTATFNVDVDQWILIHNLMSYSAVQPADEVLYYYLVPQKVNAVVEFPTHLGKDIVWNDDFTVAEYTPVSPTADDEFLLYSKFLDQDKSVADQDFTFYEVSSDKWSTGGRVYGYKRNIDGTQGQGAVYRMITNSPKSAEVVRMASNPTGSPSVTGTGVCKGAQFRSAVFELANYPAFQFNAKVNGQSTENIMLTYVPDQKVTISIDVTSYDYEHADGSVAEVDPFGTAFDIYIDAPMLEVDETDVLYTSGKLTRDPSVAGRYVYHVDASRSIEAGYGSGETKTLVFKTHGIVTAGDIRITADDTKVIYDDVKFKLHNSSLTGTMQYRNKTTGAVTPVPASSFVPFEVFPTYNRIGTVTIAEAGGFELRLREEYEYDWSTDDVKFQYVAEDGTKYEKVYGSLSALYSSLGSPVILEPVQ